jgi:hypothetical protein
MLLAEKLAWLFPFHFVPHTEAAAFSTLQTYREALNRGARGTLSSDDI